MLDVWFFSTPYKHLASTSARRWSSVVQFTYSLFSFHAIRSLPRPITCSESFSRLWLWYTSVSLTFLEPKWKLKQLLTPTIYEPLRILKTMSIPIIHSMPIDICWEIGSHTFLARSTDCIAVWKAIFLYETVCSEKQLGLAHVFSGGFSLLVCSAFVQTRETSASLGMSIHNSILEIGWGTCRVTTFSLLQCWHETMSCSPSEQMESKCHSMSEPVQWRSYTTLCWVLGFSNSPFLATAGLGAQCFVFDLYLNSSM